MPITRSENSDEWRERGDTWTGKTRINTNLGSDFIYICECDGVTSPETLLQCYPVCSGVTLASEHFVKSFVTVCKLQWLQWCQCRAIGQESGWIVMWGHCPCVTVLCHPPPLPANPGSGPTINLSPASLNWVRCLRWGSVSHRMFIFVVELNELTRLSQPLIYCHRSKGCSHITLSRA